MTVHFFHRKSSALLMALCLLLTFAAPFANTRAASAAVPDTLTGSVLSDKAVNFINTQYKTGEEIDGYNACVLALAGQQLDSDTWTKDGVSLKQKQANLSDLVGNSDLPLSYILANQNQDGSFQPVPGAYGTRVAMQSLAKVKADISPSDALFNKLEAAIAKSVAYFNSPYQQGKWTYSPSGNQLDYRTVEALADAGEDLSAAKWTVNGKSLKQAVLDSAAVTSASTTAKATDLAKELTAVAAVSPADQMIETLTNAILAKRVEKTTSLQFGDSIYDDVLVLNALGKAGKLADIDQAKALAYLSTFKHSHENEWNTAAGAAWGSYSPKESDLTAQVLQVLSGFAQTGETGTAVKQAIADGFKYLQDIQNKDTGAIAHEYDSVFTTAETLIANQANGHGFKSYNSSTSGWAFKSKTKTVAELLLSAVKAQDTERVNRLSQLLLERHTKDGFENSIFSDMLAYIALGEANKIGPIADDARAYILKKQSADPQTKGVWGETFDKFYPDFLSTTQAVRALTYLPGYDKDTEVQAAIDSALNYLKSKQQDDGGIYNAGDDALVDTAEAVITLKKAGDNPYDWKNAQGKTPVNYLFEKAANADGSFGAIKNSFAAAEALYAYHTLGTFADKSFADVTVGTYSWAIDAIQTLAGASIVNGVDDGKLYEPARAVTRAEFAAILTRIMGVQVEASSDTAFSDVKTGQWYTHAVAAAAKKGWIRGYEDHTFRPNNVISREEMAVILVRANQWNTPANALTFKDTNAISNWAVGEVGAVVQKGLVKGFEDNTFRPKNSASRAEAAVMLYRMAGSR